MSDLNNYNWQYFIVKEDGSLQALNDFGSMVIHKQMIMIKENKKTDKYLYMADIKAKFNLYSCVMLKKNNLKLFRKATTNNRYKRKRP